MLDERGQAATEARVACVARATALAACLFCALLVMWGIAAPLGSGHVAAAAARGIVAENMWQWGILAPVREYVLTPPTPDLYYMHHPWGIFWAVALTYKVFGAHDYVCRLPAAVMTIASPALLWGIGRALWGPIAGALAAWGYVVVPIALAFGAFTGFEVPVIFGTLLVSWTYLRFSQNWSKRWLVASVIALLWTVCSGWEAFVFLAIVLAVLVVAGLLLPAGWFGTVDTRRFAQWWVIAVGISVVAGLGWFALVHHYGQLEDLLGSHRVRTAGSEASLESVLEARKHWIDLMFTPLAVLIGKLAVPVFVLRSLLARRPQEIFPLAILVMAVFRYVHFKQGADVHIFWPHEFAAYFALSLGVLAATFEQSLRWTIQRLRRRKPGAWSSFVTLAFFGLAPLAMLPDAISVLVYGHHTGFRYNEKGNPIRQDVDKVTALKWISGQLEGGATVEIHRSMETNWGHSWALRRPIAHTSAIGTKATHRGRYLVADARELTAADQTKLAEGFRVTAVGPFWFVDYEQPAGPLESYALRAEKPGLLARYFSAPVDPLYVVTKSPYRTWELRHHFDQQPNPAPTAPAETAEERRIAHNLTLARGDLALAERLRTALVGELDRGPAVELSDGSEILGVHHDQLRHEIWIYVRAAGPTASSLTFTVRSRVEKKKPLSLIPADEVDRRAKGSVDIDSTLWKMGFVYVISAEIRKRLGREVFEGHFNSVVKPKTGPLRIRLLELD